MFPDIDGQVENLLEQLHLEEPLCTEYRQKWNGCNVSLLTLDRTWLEWQEFDYIPFGNRKYWLNDPLWRPGILFK